MEAPIVAALIGFGGVIVGLIARDIVMALIVAREKRSNEMSDKDEERRRARRNLVRIYSDPLLEAARSLRLRLDEIVEGGRARYLLASTSKSSFNEYKRISTLYRLAALLGWIRAYRRQRSYLDPGDAERKQEPTSIRAVEAALADGHHVEAQRLEELMRLWRVPATAVPASEAKLRLAAKLDSFCQEFLAAQHSLTASDLTEGYRAPLVNGCAALIAESLNTEIPDSLIAATAGEAVVFLGIKEAYIYRDWQAAIGDLMIVPVAGDQRRFDVIGFGAFEEKYLEANLNELQTQSSRWFVRLESLISDLDMQKAGIFDARREQIRKLRQACLELESQITSEA